MFRVVVGARDVSALVNEGMSFSNVDPGGCEAASFTLPGAAVVELGDAVRIETGSTTVWEGRVSEVGYDYGGHSTSVSCQGYGAVLKETTVQEVWIDSDINKWGEPGPGRVLPLEAAGYDGYGGNILPSQDPTVSPAVETYAHGAWSSGGKPHCIPTWVSPIEIAYMTFTWNKGAAVDPGDPNWHWAINAWSGLNYSGTLTNGTEQRAAGPVSGVLTPTIPSRIFELLFYYGAGPAGAALQRYTVQWSNLALIGKHGLALRQSTTDPLNAALPPVVGAIGGFYPSDILTNALERLDFTLDTSGIEEASSFLLRHYVQYSPVEVEQVVSDMANYMGWHWGTWPANGIGGAPAFVFAPPPVAATCWVSLQDCDQVQFSQRLDDYYTSVKVTYGTADGSAGTVTVDRATFGEVDVERELVVDLGAGSATAAESFGNMILDLKGADAMATGSATIKGSVGDKEAFMLRAGRDRLRIMDLPTSNLIPNGLYDFHIKRVETQVGADGVSTSVELGRGTDLIEVLQARLSDAVERIV